MIHNTRLSCVSKPVKGTEYLFLSQNTQTTSSKKRVQQWSEEAWLRCTWLGSFYNEQTLAGADGVDGQSAEVFSFSLTASIFAAALFRRRICIIWGARLANWPAKPNLSPPPLHKRISTSRDGIMCTRENGTLSPLSPSLTSPRPSLPVAHQFRGSGSLSAVERDGRAWSRSIAPRCSAWGY